MLNDLRLGVRSFRRHGGLAAAAILSLALGIGANTAIFSVLNGVVFNALPYQDPDGLVMVWETSAENQERWVAPANFVDWRRDARSFASLSAFDNFSPTLSGHGEAERLRALGVSGTFFATLGASAALGRTLLAQDDEAARPAVAVLSDGLWVRLFAASPDVLGRAIVLDGRAYTIVGVMPATFTSPLDSAGVDIWVSGDRGVPRTFPFAGDLTAVRDSHIIFVVGRLAPGVTRAVAQQELGALMVELARRHPDTNAGLGVNVVSLHEAMVGETRPLLVLLQLAVGLMLLIACANVAHLLLGRAAARQAEMATRVALGAGRSRLLRQLMIETLAIAIPGGVLGIGLAAIGVRVVIRLAPSALPRVEDIGLDPIVLAFAIGVTLATAVLFGIGPAFQTSGIGTIAESNLRIAGARKVKAWHHAIVVMELAVTEVLLVGAALLLASFAASQRVDLGFDTRGRIAADLSLAPDRYLKPAPGGGIDVTRKIQFVNDVLDTVTSTPGVRAAGASFTSPLTGAPNRGITIIGRPPKPAGLEDTADFQVITSDFFRAAGMTLVRGRSFTGADQAATTPVAIVNQAFADAYLAGEDPLGQRFAYGAKSRVDVVGVVANARYRSVESPADPTFYLPMTQNNERWPFMSFTVWTDRDASALAPAIRAAVRRADPNQAITLVRPYCEAVGDALAARRFNTMLVTTFALVALLLAAVGTYGVMSYAVSTRTRELGLRAALGARPVDLMRLVLGQGATLTAIAVAVGLAASVLTTRAMAWMLYGVAPRDAATLATVAATLALVAGVATWLPARQAVRIAPLAALRE
jgi:putative ABC transport system permease protein